MKIAFIFRALLYSLPFHSLLLLAQHQLSKTSVVHIGLIYPLSSNGRLAAEYSNPFSMHGLIGVSGAETGVALAGVGLNIRGNARGLQLSGVYNQTGGHVQGTQLTGVVNTAHSAKALQLAGVTNVVSQEFTGVQLAGVVNVAGKTDGLQLAGLGNTSRGSSQVTQISGVFNRSNQANNQIGGLVNVAKKVRGIQLAGLINIADTSDYPIALLNFVKSGEKSFSLSTDEILNTLLTFRSGGRVLYGILGLGYHLQTTSLLALEGGLGAHLMDTPAFRLNLEVASLTLTDFKNREYYRYALRLLPTFKLQDRWEIFAGPSLNQVHFKNENGPDLHGLPLWEKVTSRQTYGLYLGLTGGVQFKL
ncbi:hypothetical protein [Siphonobacter sp. SORGH_AS_1065]|uniref:hypothetical protein n=1 Tax=Siphonobacter sp. SORGH_AS_1065 TaxID=3041795 RepID=UPI0027D86CB2|nr:hypothetical protein [Siphonobacter sp. SORGH_AS_1065]